MPLYMTQFSYDALAWPALMEQPERLASRLKDILEGKLGGRIVLLSFCPGFGEFDGVLIFEASDDTAATAILLASLSSTRHIRDSRSTKLLSPQEMMEALGQAATVVSPGPPRGR